MGQDATPQDTDQLIVNDCRLGAAFRLALEGISRGVPMVGMPRAHALKLDHGTYRLEAVSPYYLIVWPATKKKELPYQPKELPALWHTPHARQVNMAVSVNTMHDGNIEILITGPRGTLRLIAREPWIDSGPHLTIPNPHRKPGEEDRMAKYKTAFAIEANGSSRALS